jgi:hypothetical protein
MFTGDLQGLLATRRAQGLIPGSIQGTAGGAQDGTVVVHNQDFGVCIHLELLMWLSLIAIQSAAINRSNCPALPDCNLSIYLLSL